MKNKLLKACLLLGVVASLAISQLSVSATDETKTPEFDEANIALRFTAMSDVHIEKTATKKDTLFANALKKSKEVAGGSENLNLVGVAGDIFDYVPSLEAPRIKTILDENLNADDTELFLAVGNHDYYFEDAFINGNNKFEESFKPYVYQNEDGRKDSNYHTVVNGYHFITVLGYDGDHGYDSLRYLKSELKKATADDPTKPVFIFTHVPPANTCAGSDELGRWQSTTIGAVLEKYPQAVIFAGHTHYDATHEDAIWQGKYTSIDCGTCQENFHFIEVDQNGTMRMTTYNTDEDITKMDAVREPSVFEIPYVAPAPEESSKQQTPPAGDDDTSSVEEEPETSDESSNKEESSKAESSKTTTVNDTTSNTKPTDSNVPKTGSTGACGIAVTALLASVATVVIVKSKSK